MDFLKLFETYFDEPSYKHTDDEKSERLAAISQVLSASQIKNFSSELADTDDDAKKLKLKIAFYILVSISNRSQNEYRFAADACCYPIIKSYENNNSRRYTWNYFKDTQVYRLIVRDTKTYLDVMRALSLLPVPRDDGTYEYDGVLMEQTTIGNAGYGMASAWNYCAYVKQKYRNDRNGEVKQESTAWKKISVRPCDPTFAVMGSNFTLEKSIVVTDGEKLNRMKLRLIQNILGCRWLCVCPNYAYLGAMQFGSTTPRIERLYEFMFYLCMENCSMHTPETGVVKSRDTVSLKPLTFEVKNASTFIDRTLVFFKLACSKKDVGYNELDLTCIAPIVVTKHHEWLEADYKKENASDTILSKMRRDKISADGHSLAVLIQNFLYENDDKKILGVENNILHLSLYTPTYKQAI